MVMPRQSERNFKFSGANGKAAATTEAAAVLTCRASSYGSSNAALQPQQSCSGSSYADGLARMRLFLALCSKSHNPRASINGGR